MAFTTCEAKLAYETRGEQGPPVLLIMGLGMRGVVWESQIEDLSRDHRVAWFDNRGIGNSGPATGKYSMAHAADDAASVLDALGWETAHIVGVSFGGMVAQELALRHPKRLRSLTLIATHPGGVLGVVPRLVGFYAFFRAQFGNRPRALMTLLYPRDFLATLDRSALEQRMALQAVPQPSATVRRQLLAVIRHDTRRRLAHIAAPTLVLKPTADVLVRPFHSDRLAARIPGARLVPLVGAGHGIIFQCQEQVNAAIRAHVARCIEVVEPAAAA